MARLHWPEPYPTVTLSVLDCADADGGLLTIIIDDRSASTFSTDPKHRRQPEMRQALRWIAQGDCHTGDSAAIAQFDDVIAPIPPTGLNDDLEGLLEALPKNAPQSSSSLGPSTRRATTWANNNPELAPALLVATDGFLDDYGEAFAALEQFPGPVYILALGGPLPDEWNQTNAVTGVVELTGQVKFGDIARSLTQMLQQASNTRNGQPQ